MRIAIFSFVGVVLFWVAPLAAIAVTIEFAGTTGGGLPFEGTLTYDPALPDGDPQDSDGLYVDPAGVLSISVDGSTFQTNTGPLVFEIRDDDRVDLSAVGGGIVYVDGISASSDAIATPPGLTVTAFSIDQEVVGFVPNPFLPSDALPDAMGISSALLGARIHIEIADLPGVPGYFGLVSSASPIPEPGSAALVAFGGLLLTLLRRSGGTARG